MTIERMSQYTARPHVLSNAKKEDVTKSTTPDEFAITIERVTTARLDVLSIQNLEDVTR